MRVVSSGLRFAAEEAADHFVPDHRVQRFIDMREARYQTPHREEQHSYMAFIPVAALILVAPQLGLARHALERTRSSLPGKPVAYTVYRAAGKSPTHQYGVATAATRFHQAELMMRQACLDIDAAAARQLPGMEVRARIRNDTGVIAELVKDGIDAPMTANGAGSFADANVLSLFPSTPQAEQLAPSSPPSRSSCISRRPRSRSVHPGLELKRSTR
jgi:hypothetical protein